MNEVSSFVKHAASRWVTMMWPVVWQSAILAGIVFLVTWRLKRAPAALRFWLWMLVPLKLLIMPVVTVGIPLLPAEAVEEFQVRPDVAVTLRAVNPIAVEEAVGAGSVGSAEAVRSPTLPEEEEAWLSSGAIGDVGSGGKKVRPSVWVWVMGAWLAGVGFFAVKLGRGWWRMSRVVANGREVEGFCASKAAEEAARTIGLKGVPKILVTEEAVSPFVLGLVRPVVVLPAALVRRISAEELAAVLAHEFAHLRRRDLLIGWVLAVCEAVYFFHPALDLAKRRVMFERERACDELVLASGQANRGVYAQAMIAAADVHRALGGKTSPVPVVAESFGDLRRRLTMMAWDLRQAVRLPRRVVILLGILAVVALPGFVLTARSAEGPVERTESGKTVEPEGEGTGIKKSASELQASAEAAKEGSGEEREEAERANARMRRFVKIVVGKDAMTFEGKETTWEELPSLLEKVPDREHTVLTLAAASDQMPLGEFMKAQARAARVREQFGFEYLSFVGVHPLGSKGDPSQETGRMRQFVKIVVGKDAMTFEGKETTWEELPSLLEKVPDREHTVLTLAAASDEMPLGEFMKAQTRAARVREQFGFEYLSFVGVHPLGSKGDPSQEISEPTSSRAGAAKTEEEGERRGRITGVVVNANTGEPIKGAYVAIDRSGDAGGANLERFMQQGIYATAETDEEGRFVLEGVAFMDDHPFMVTRPGFVRHDQTVALARGADVDLTVKLKPAGAISVTLVDADGKPMEEPALVRLQAKDRRAFRPIREDWPTLKYRMELAEAGRYSFGELEPGVFSIEAVRLGSHPRKEPLRNLAIYHGRIAEVELGKEEKEVELKAEEHNTRLTLKIEKDPEQDPEKTSVRPLQIVAISRDQSLLVWADRRWLHPEDERLGRLMEGSMFYRSMSPVGDYTFENLPEGVYSVFVLSVRRSAVCVRGKKVEIGRGAEVAAEIPWAEPFLVGLVDSRPLDKRVTVELRDAPVGRLCEMLTAITDSKINFIADPSIRDETLTLRVNDVSIWEVLERVYLDKGWKAEWRVEEGKETLVLRPEAAIGTPLAAPEGAAPAEPGEIGAMDRRVTAEFTEAPLERVFEILSAQVGSGARLVAAAEIRDEKVTLRAFDVSLRELVKKLCAQKGWEAERNVDEEGRETVVLRPK